jgi:hypothetical protein
MNISQKISLFVTKEKRWPNPFELCPRFETCQLNKCPLHPDFHKLENDLTDTAILKKQKWQ